jgi:esterase/lipase superfamily enzyme
MKKSDTRDNAICLRFKSLVLLLALFLLVSCAHSPEIIGIENPDVPVGSIENAKTRKIFIASTRAPSDAEGALFSSTRSRNLGLASVVVSIPPNHVAGKIEQPRSLPPDPRKEFAIVDPEVYGTDYEFVKSVNHALRQWPSDKRDILMFVHGYNTSTSDAVLRLAQFVEDSGFEGVPVLFSWASAADVTKYVYDLNSSLAAREETGDLAALLSRTDVAGFNLVAHSMGAFLTMEALRDLARTGQLDRTGRLRNIVLASPDIDLDVFRAQLREIDQELDIFVLLSRDDAALKFSRFIAGGVPRVGASVADELTNLGAVVIDLSQVDNSASGSHSKFAGSPDIVKLIGDGLNRNGSFDKAEAQQGLQALTLGLPLLVFF